MRFSFKAAPYGRLMIVSALAAVLVAPSAAQRSFVMPHVLEKSGSIAGILWDADGGQVNVDLSSTVAKQVQLPIGGLVSPYGNDQFFAWLTANMNGRPTTETFNFYTTEKGERRLLSLEKCSPGAVKIPACDVDSKEARGLEVEIHPGRMMDLGPFDGVARKIDAKKQKMWLPSNFRLSVGDLPCGRVSKIDSFTIKQGLAGDLDGDGSPDMVTEMSDISFLVPMSDGSSFVKSKLGEFPFRHEMLDDDGNVLFTVTGTLVITSADLDEITMSPTSSEALIRVRGHHRGHVTVLK